VSKFVIAFALTYVGGLAATLLIDAAWGIYLYELEYFLNPPIRWWYGSLPELRYSFTIALFIMISFIIRNKKYSENRLFDVPQTKWLLVFSIMMVIISFYAVWPEMHSRTVKTHFKLILFLALSYKIIDTPIKFERMIWFFLIGNFYLGWVAHSTGRIGGHRLENIGPSDTGGDSNATAAIFITAVPILLYYIMKGKTWQRILSVIILAFVIDGIVLINSRGAFVGLIMGCIYFAAFNLFFTMKETTKEKMKKVGLIIVAICMFAYLTDAVFWERMTTIHNEVESAKAGASRTFFWKKTFDLVRQHPFGVGTWGYQYLSPQFIPEEMLSRGMRAVHSTYFQVLAEMGYLGVPVFFGLLVSNFRLMRKTRHYLREEENKKIYYQGIAIESGFVAFLTACAFISRLQAEVLYWFVLFTACFGNIYMLKNQASENIAAPNGIQEK